ncbi:MAG: phage tail family protein [Chloroflexi bacterium]|nr:phage tail family protein [Chloroflexota bacterium]
MTWTLSIIAGGAEINVSDGQDYILTGLDGIGMAPANRIIEQGPQQHGASDRGFRLQPRKIALSLLARGGSDSDWWQRRNSLLALLRPSDTPLALRLTRSDGTVRQIDCYYSAELGLAVDPDLRASWQPVVVELLAPDPTWYDPTGTTITYGIGGAGDQMTVPLAIPWHVGASSINTTRQVTYSGTWDAYPVITVIGPATNLVITNETLGDKLDFTGVSLGAGERRIIDCRYGQKTVTDANGTNRIADLTADSNLATFRIGAHPNPPGGVNSIRVSAQNITAGTEIYLQFNARYIGV